MQRTSPECPWADSEEGAVTLEQPQGKKWGPGPARQGRGPPPQPRHPSQLTTRPAPGWGWGLEPQSQRLLEGLEGVLGVLPNPHITEVLSQGQATPGLSEAKGTKQQFATLRPQPPARAPRATEAGSGPAAGTHLPRALRHGAPAPPGVPARGPRGPRYSGRRPAGSAPPRQKICWAGWLVLSGVLSPRGAAGRRDSPRPHLGVSPVLTGVTAPSSARLAPEADSLSGSACLLALLSQDHTPRRCPAPTLGQGSPGSPPPHRALSLARQPVTALSHPDPGSPYY